MADVNLSELLTDNRLDTGKSPVDPDISSEFRDTLEFEEMDVEFRKSETEGPNAVRWRELNQNTVNALSNKSKDLVLATRLVYGLFREEGYLGLAVGISILKDMVEQQWENMIPPVKRERGRAGSFDWMAEKVAANVEASEPTPDVGNFVLVAHDRLLEIDELLETKMQKSSVALGPLIRALRPFATEARQALEQASAAQDAGQEAAPVEPSPANAQNATAGEAHAQSQSVAPADPASSAPSHSEVQTASSLQPDGQPAAQPSAQASAQAPAQQPSTVASTSAPAVDVPDVNLGEGVDKSISSMCAAIGRVATHMRGESLKDPRTFLLGRFAAWGKIAQAPSASAGKTMLPPPQKAKLTEIESLAKAGNHEGLVKCIEGVIQMSPYWLDCQYLVAASLADMGGEYAKAQAVVEGETAAFVKRLPEIVDYSFSDGMPFASAETKSWLQSLSSGDGENGAGGIDPALVEARSSAVKLAQGGQLPAGLRVLTEYANSRAGGREAFLVNLEIGEFCLRFETLLPLFAMLDGMNEKERNLGLSEWDPQLAISLASLNIRALNHKNAKRIIAEPEIRERKTTALRMLSQLDIALATELSTTPTG